jgi:hypothetical protein
MNEFQHRVPKQERILAVIEPPRHFVKVGRHSTLRRETHLSPPAVPLSKQEAFQNLCYNVEKAHEYEPTILSL